MLTATSALAGTLTALPDGSIAGSPGSTIGWGYSLSNSDPNFWYLPTSISLPSFSIGTPTVLFDYPAVGPMDTVTETYNGTLGLLQLTINANAAIGSSNSGPVVLYGEYWTGDPYTDPTAAFDADAPDLTASITGTVSAVATTPEPSLTWAAAGLLSALLVMHRRRSRSRSA
jgi:hypothetical protein